MKVLVTGGTGFIGTHLVKKLVEQGNEVRCLVRENSKTNFLKSLGVELVVGDTRNESSLKNVADGVDVVYHLAAIVDHKKIVKSYKEHNDTGVAGTDPHPAPAGTGAHHERLRRP